jgi:hypothetical protein
VTQNLERFEQGRLQRTALPGRLFYYRVEQPPLLTGRLLEEQLARPTRQAKSVDGVIARDWCGLPDVLDLAKETILFAAQGASLFIEKLLRDAPVELIKIHRPDARFDLVVAGLKLLVGFCTGGLLGTVGIQNSLAQPVQNGRRDNEFSQYAGNLRLTRLNRVEFSVRKDPPRLVEYAPNLRKNDSVVDRLDPDSSRAVQGSRRPENGASNLTSLLGLDCRARGQSLPQFNEVRGFAKHAVNVRWNILLGNQSPAPASEQNHWRRWRVGLHGSCYSATVYIGHTQVSQYDRECFTAISCLAKDTDSCFATVCCCDLMTVSFQNVA